MENKIDKIGCRTGRVTIVDPNKLDGQESNNVPVPLEDLNISVVLRTSRRGRTVLSKENEAGYSESSQNVSINFIEGTKINGERNLTTKFTDLTTSFEKGTFNDETLGITDIDIDFNPSMAPMITIKFVDVRGSSIFQNEEGVSGNNSGNKFSTFFQLPYPLFELEIKGYYGRPVTYCLHMLKFTSLFNSKTGNFEIQCQFIGYTYAMLSDLLIGYLKAIPYTNIGAQKYKALNEARKNPILNLNELMQAIGDINTGVAKLSSTSESAKDRNSIGRAKDILSDIKDTLQALGHSLEYKTTNKDEYNYIIKTSTKPIEETKDTIEKYQENITTLINNFNSVAENIVKISVNEFTEIGTSGNGKGLYQGLTLGDLKTGSMDTILGGKIGSSIGLNNFKIGVQDDLRKYFDEQTDSFKFDVYDLTSLNEKIKKTSGELDKTDSFATQSLADELKRTFVSELRFEPTVRNIVEIFTVAIEVMMETIYAVSTAAENEGNNERKNELERTFSKDYENSSDIKQSALTSRKFFAWPDYREKKDNTYVDKYLGDPNVLDNAYKVNEVAFIDDLLSAFIKAQELANKVESDTEKEITTWYPINPLDSNLFNSVEPYERLEFTDYQEIIRMMVQRGMTFLAYTNKSDFFPEDNKDILAMAEIEADAIMRSIKNPKLIQSLTRLTPSSIQDVKVNTGASSFDFMVKKMNVNGVESFVYNYPNTIGQDNNVNTPAVIPLSDSFSGYWNLKPNELKSKAGWDDETNTATASIFLTNYSSELGGKQNKSKPIDGTMYIKIIPAERVDGSIGVYAGPNSVKNESIFNLEKMAEEEVSYDAGYNSFGGNLGMQEYKFMDFGGDIGDKLPLMYVFYKDTHVGLSSPRTKDKGSLYDFNFNKQRVEAAPTKEMFFGGGKKTHQNLGKNRNLFKEILAGNTDVSFPYFEQPANNVSILNWLGSEYRDPYDDNSFSLFGSKFYYMQNDSIYKDYNKAFLYLNNLPWNVDRGNPLKKYEILHLFNKKAGMVHVPRLWTAWLGSILWRLSEEKTIVNNGKIVGGGSGPTDPIIWPNIGSNNFDGIPDRNEFLQYLDWGSGVYFYNDIKDDDILNRLPEQVVVEFKNAFFDFVNGTDSMISWDAIKTELEIFTGDKNEFYDFFDNIKNNTKKDSDGKFYTPTSAYKNTKFVGDKSYKIMTYIKSNGNLDSISLELNGTYGTNSAMKVLVDAMMQEVIIVNNNYSIWTNPIENNSLYKGVSVDTNRFNLYFSKLAEVINKKGDGYSPTKIKKDLEQQIFGTADENVIKLLLYNTCKNIHDKWLAGATDPENLLFQCGDKKGQSIRNNTDYELYKKYGGDKVRLIDSFRFVSRSFKDIGDKLFINPIPINDFLIKTPNTSSYDAISSLLDANKFTFDALPTFINYKDPKNLETMFTPMPDYEKAVENGSCGPSFVCVYAGQTSKHLDFVGSDYKNDGFDFSCNGNEVSQKAPNDFTETISSSEDPVAVFKVGFGQQNQNIFKDITLDQTEFTETDESLQIQDEISQKGGETNRSLAGQNIYNVYSVRSYTAQVEMMGNPMIQPMMYFQLDNIPMFHGAYMITRVKHSLKPNTMSTSFTGVRIRYGETPLITAMDLFMSLADGLNTSKAGEGVISGQIKGTFPPIVTTIIENGVMNGYMNETGKIKFEKVPVMNGVTLTNSQPSEAVLIAEAIEPLKFMMRDLVAFMVSENFVEPTISISSMYRKYASQQTISNTNDGKGTAKVGTSNHGWGIAIDLLMKDKSGKVFNITPKTSSSKDSFNFVSNPVYGWLMKNGYKYGWINPKGLRDGVGSVEEHWHFEYHGTSAPCLLSENLVVYGQTIGVDEKKIFDFVKNPKETDGNEGVYIGCKFKFIETKIEAIEKNSVLSNKEAAENQVKVKQKLKSIGLTKSQVAGVMGNMLQESTFNPRALNKVDRNGFASFGLIQWNAKFYNENLIGKTVESQLNYLVDMGYFKKFVNVSTTKESVEDSAYEFAKIVEICHLCNLGYKKYSNSYQYVRTSYAKDFYRRFNTPSDALSW